MSRALPTRRVRCHPLKARRLAGRRVPDDGHRPRTSGLVLAVLGVALLGGLALMFACALATGT